MADPQDVTGGMGEVVRQGLGIFGQGVSTIAQVLMSGDAALKEVDGALTGGGPRPASDLEVAQQVVSLVREGRDESARTGDPRTPGSVARFQDAMRLLFQVPLTGDAGGLSGLMPSPGEAIRSALRGLRGSMALVRLANGAGTLADVEEVARFAEDLVRGFQTSRLPLVPAQTDDVVVPAPNKAAPKRSRARRKKKGPGPAEAAFARAVALEMGDAQVTEWAEEFAGGKIDEPTWVSRLTGHAALTRESLDDVFERAQARMRREQGD